jgi:hypothetical protein
VLRGRLDDVALSTSRLPATGAANRDHSLVHRASFSRDCETARGHRSRGG